MLYMSEGVGTRQHYAGVCKMMLFSLQFLRKKKDVLVSFVRCTSQTLGIVFEVLELSQE